MTAANAPTESTAAKAIIVGASATCWMTRLNAIAGSLMPRYEIASCATADAANVTNGASPLTRYVEAPPAWAIRSEIDRAFAAAGLERQIVCEVNEWVMVLDLVGAGVGVALVPSGLDFTLHPRSTAALQLVPLNGVQLERRVDLVLPSGHVATPVARRFAELVRSKVSSA
jgi:DNA-binding transcriptional LysR family regulator